MKYRQKYTMQYPPAENAAKSMKSTLFQITALRLTLQPQRGFCKKIQKKVNRNFCHYYLSSASISSKGHMALLRNHHFYI